MRKDAKQYGSSLATTSSIPPATITLTPENLREILWQTLVAVKNGVMPALQAAIIAKLAHLTLQTFKFDQVDLSEQED